MKSIQLLLLSTVTIFLFILTQTEAGPTKHQCSNDIDCSSTTSCSNGFCQDPCRWAHEGQICTVENHIPKFSCRPGFGYPTGSDRICLPSEWSCYVDEEDIKRSLKCEIPHIGSRSLKVRLCVD